MMSLKQVAIALVVLFSIAFSACSWIATLQRNARVAQIRAECQEQVAQAKDAQLQAERALDELRLKFDVEVRDAVQGVEDRYIALLAGLNGMPESAPGSTGKELSDATGAALPVHTGQDRCDGASRLAFRELRKNLLTVTRDCAITAEHYNGLLKFYEDARKEQSSFY